MNSHHEIQRHIKTAVQEAIWRAGQVEGAEEVALTNTDVVEALLEVVGVWSAVHGFEKLLCLPAPVTEASSREPTRP
jgi:hypothetical protein